MTRMQSFVGAAVLVAASTASAQTPPAPTAQAKPADRSELRHQIYVMEGALARAVNFGAAKLNQEIRAVMPDMLVLAGESTARGFQLENYGVFFDVEVPVLRQSMMWSLRTMLDQDEQGAAEALAQLRTFVASSSGSERAAAEGALRRLEAQLRPFGVARRSANGPGVLAGDRGTVAAGAPVTPGSAPPKSQMSTLLMNDPNKVYTDAVVTALIDAMIDFSAPMTSLRPDEYFTVAARDNERRDLLAPQNPYEEVSTFMLRIKGSDLAAYRAGGIDRDEARKRVQVEEF